jgi:hypothetical protein
MSWQLVQLCSVAIECACMSWTSSHAAGGCRDRFLCVYMLVF